MSRLDISSICLDELAAHENDQAVVLTVNNRLARRLVLVLGRVLHDADRGAGAAPTILPFSAWVDALSEQVAFNTAGQLAAHRLDDFGARLLWRDAIEHCEAGVLDAWEAARLAAEAEHLVQEWHVRPLDNANEEYAQFVAWRDHYHATLQACDADDADTRLNRLIERLRAGMLRIPDALILAGMRELSPRQQDLLEALQQRGSRLYRLAEPTPAATMAQRYAASDPGAEWRAAAAWAARSLDASPEGRFAIIAAGLQDQAPFARRVLDAALGHHAFNLSVGRPLDEWPLVRAALAWLGLLARPWPHASADLGQALLAGQCAGHRHEAAARGRLDAEWRWKQVVSLDEAEWLAALRNCPRLLEAWQAAAAALTDHGPDGLRGSAGAWAHAMRHSLTHLGFPGDASPDSAAYQVMEAFEALLQRFAALSPAAGRLSASDAVHLLWRLARETPFQPERAASARLDVLGLLEAEGERWDGVWILGLTDDVLPAPPSPNPLLPAQALAQANAPRATAARELAYANELFAALQQCAPTVVVSHALLDGERELRASPMAVPLTSWQPDDAHQPSGPAETATTLEVVEHDPGPPLPPGAVLTGGTAILEAQSRNPLWAFARYRLGARVLPAYVPQLPTATLRGNFLHLAMQTLWESLRTSRSLAEAAANDTLDDLLDHAIETAARRELAVLSPAVRKLECERARNILVQWLALEAQRQPFEITAIEGKTHWQHGALQLTLRLDRVDQLQDGSVVILDYKSGVQLDIKGWARERPVSLQMPFYAAVLTQPREAQAASAVTGLVLVRLHAREVGALGVAGEPLGIPGVQQAGTPAENSRKAQPFDACGWNEWLEHWQRSVVALADEFIAGRADNVVAHNADLQYCEVLPFLRLDLEIDLDETAQ